jgi:hypothetical protein
MRRLLVLAITLACLACNGESNPTSPDGPVAFAQVYKSKTSGVNRQTAEIISRQARWVEAWDEITAGQSPKPAIPAVDFESVILIYASGGEIADSCSDIRIESVNRVGGALTVSIVEERRPGCVCPPVVIHPVHVVSVPRAATGASFTFRATNLSGCT